jgi:hypothetical protein
MAKFYSVMIERGLWTNQKDLAEGLRVSTAHVSRMLAVSRLPESILRLFVDKPLSSADVATVHTLIKEFGASVISERAKSVPRESTVSESASRNARNTFGSTLRTLQALLRGLRTLKRS